MNNKRNERGQFLPNDQLEPLVWVRAEEVKEADEVVQVSEVKAGSEPYDLAQHNPPSLTFTVGDEEVVLMGLPTKRAKRGERSNRCCVCGCETDTSKNYYCKTCWAEYQRERYRSKGR